MTGVQQDSAPITSDHRQMKRPIAMVKLGGAQAPLQVQQGMQRLMGVTLDNEAPGMVQNRSAGGCVQPVLWHSPTDPIDKPVALARQTGLFQVDRERTCEQTALPMLSAVEGITHGPTQIGLLQPHERHADCGLGAPQRFVDAVADFEVDRDEPPDPLPVSPVDGRSGIRPDRGQLEIGRIDPG